MLPGGEDYELALATFRAACERWPGTPINASRRSGLSGVMARQRVREFYDRAGINRFPLGDFLTQRLNTRSHAGERRVDGLLVPVLNFLLDFPKRTRHDLPLEVPLVADELGSGRAFTGYELVEIVAPTLHFAVGQIAALLTLTSEATLLFLPRRPPRVVEPVLPRRNLKVAKKLLKLSLRIGTTRSTARKSKLPIFGRFVPQTISPIHVAASSTPEDAGGHSRTGLSPLTAIRNRAHQIICMHRWERIPHKDPDRVAPSSDVGVKPRQPGVLELSGISLVSLWDQNTWVELARTRSATVG